MKFGLDEHTLLKLNSVFEKYPEIEEVIIYGSRAIGNYREGSDIDISLKGNVTEEIRSSVYRDIDDLNLPYLIDLSIYNQLTSPDFLGHIDRNGVRLYKCKSII